MALPMQRAKTLRLAASEAERNSEQYPLVSDAICRSAVELTDAREFEAVAGSGVQRYAHVRPTGIKLARSAG